VLSLHACLHLPLSGPSHLHLVDIFKFIGVRHWRLSGTCINMRLVIAAQCSSLEGTYSRCTCTWAIWHAPTHALNQLTHNCTQTGAPTFAAMCPPQAPISFTRPHIHTHRRSHIRCNVPITGTHFINTYHIHTQVLSHAAGCPPSQPWRRSCRTCRHRCARLLHLRTGEVVFFFMHGHLYRVIRLHCHFRVINLPVRLETN